MSTWFFNLYESMDFSANWAFQLKVVLDAVRLYLIVFLKTTSDFGRVCRLFPKVRTE